MDPELLAQARRIAAPESDAVVTARARLGDAGGAPTPEVGSLLGWAARACSARATVEIGAAGGVSGLWLLTGLLDNGVLTTIEPNPHAHALAADAYADAGTSDRVRLILGDPLTVLPRLSDGGYDVMLLQAPSSLDAVMIEHAHRLLRPGGMLIARGVLAPRDGSEVRDAFVDALLDDPTLVTAVLPLDDGVALAIRRA